MSVKYKLFPNLLTDDPEDYIAVRTPEERPKLLQDFENPLELFGLRFENGKLSTEKKSGIIEELIKEGHSLFTPMFNMRISITGKFIGRNDEFDATRHETKLCITAGRKLSREVANKLNKKKRKP
jgi:hypothetical protein